MLATNFNKLNSVDLYKINQNYSFIAVQEKEETKKIIDVFLRILQNQNSGFANMKAPTLGSTGFTFLCHFNLNWGESNQSKVLEVFNKNYPFEAVKFVLKWQGKDLADNERFCSKVFEKLGFNSPIIENLELEPSKLKQLLKKSQTLKPALDYNKNEHSVVFMPQFEAQTFSSFVSLGYAHDLNQNDWQKILTVFGKLVVADLLIGNDDRLVRIESNQPYYLKVAFNAGNIMLLTPLKVSDKKRYIENIFTIDNATSPRLRPVKKETIAEEIEMSGLWSEEDIDYSMVSNNFSTEIADNKNANSINQSDVEMDHFHLAFCTLTDMDKISTLTQYVLSGIKAVFEENNQPLPKDLLASTKYLEEGILEGINFLKKLNNSTFIEAISPYAHEEFSKKSLELIQRNLKALQQK